MNTFTTQYGDDLTVCDLSQEFSRKYFYPDGREIYIEEPYQLFFKTDKRLDSHRVSRDEGRVVVYVPAGWTHFEWVPRDPYHPVQF